MPDLSKLSQDNTDMVMAIVDELQPVTAKQVQEELERRHGMQEELEQVTRYMEFMRSGFPRKLAHAGPDAWIVVDLG